MILKKDIEYKTFPNSDQIDTVVPKGTKLERATNIPDCRKRGKAYWALDWDGMSEKDKEFNRCIGLLLYESEIKEKKRKEIK